MKYFIKSDFDRKKPLKEILDIYQSDIGWYWFVTQWITPLWAYLWQ
jgi:hypothetical protein